MLKNLTAPILVAALALSGCESKTAETTETSTTTGVPQPSGALETAAETGIDPRFGTRPPQSCPSVTSQPTGDQIPALVRCTYERTSHDKITLVENINVQAESPRAYIASADAFATDIDANAEVLPIRGSMDLYICDASSNPASGESGSCNIDRSSDAKGECYQTTAGTWNCTMTQAMGVQTLYNQPPPTAK